MCSRVVRVHHTGVPLPSDGAELARGANVPFTAECKSVCRKSRLLGAPDERGSGGGHDESAITEIAKAGGE
jgi:hypothetical protein